MAKARVDILVEVEVVAMRTTVESTEEVQLEAVLKVALTVEA